MEARTAWRRAEGVPGVMSMRESGPCGLRCVPGRSFPEPFWIPQLQKFTAGGGCEIVVPAAPVCPNASVGPSNSWVYITPTTHKH